MGSDHLIDVSVLRNFVCSILEKIENDYGKTISISEDLYWDLSQRDRFDLKKEPHVTECGSLRDDWRFVVNAENSPGQEIPLMLLHVAPILQKLATSIPSYPDKESQESQ